MSKISHEPNQNSETEASNLVMFPASKNYSQKIQIRSLETDQDPMTELLNEFSHVLDEDIPNYLDDRFIEEEDSHDSEDVFDSLEAFMNRHQRLDVQHPDDKLIKLINERLQDIALAKAKIKYYLDEIEMFLPSKRR